MQKKIIAVFILLFLCLLSFLTYWISPSIPLATGSDDAKQGDLDLTQSGNVSSIVRLDGEWEYYPNQLLSPEDFNPSHHGTDVPKPAGYVHVPERWERYEVNGVKSSYGYATFRLNIKLPAADAKIYGIKETNIKSSNRMFVNGKEIGSSGVPGTNILDTTAENTPYTSYFWVDGRSVEIIIQVANFHYYTGGITHSIYFGELDQIGYLRQYSISSDIIVITAFLLLGAYFLAMHQMRNKEYSWLYFGLFCLACCLFTLTHGEKILALLLPGISYEIFTKIQFVSGVLAEFFLLLYARHSFPYLFKKSIMTIFQYCYVIRFLLILVAPLKILTYFESISWFWAYISILYVIYIMIIGAMKRMEGAIYLMISIVCISSVGLIICLDNLRIANIYNLLPFVTLCAVLFQVLYLSERFTNAFSTIENLSERLLTIDKLKDEFLANTSHEIKNPLHAMINIAQSLMDGAAGKLNPQQRENMALIVSTGWRSARLINDILDLSRIKNSELVLQRRAVDLRPVVQFVMEMHRHLTSGKPIHIVDKLPDNLPPVDVDEDRLVQILANLIGNSVKFTVAGEIAVSVHEQNGWLAVSVIDSGIGISEDKQKIIFESYEQLGTETGEYKGTGLGLSIVRRLVELHGGRIYVESKPGVGSTFTFTLPISQTLRHQLEETTERKAANLNNLRMSVNDLTDPAETEIAVGEESVGASVLSDERTAARHDAEHHVVLIVDDDPANRQILFNILSMDGHSVIAASTGVEALRVLEQNNNIDLVILDWMMPGLSGGEVCRQIRRRWSLSELPVLMLTARTRPEDMLAGFEVGANDFLGKPVEIGELKARIRNLFDLKKSVAALVDAEMAFLRAQIKPHFLFNTLSTIISVSDNDLNKAQQLLDRFSRYLRSSFDFQYKEHLVPIQNEVDLVQSYMFIEQARFGDRLQVEYHVNGDAKGLIPPLTIQPIVENAVRHGIMKREQGGLIRLSITTNQSDLIVEITDNGIGMTPEQLETLLHRQPSNRQGVGLLNIHRRLVHHYGEGLQIRSRPGEGTKVRFRITSNTLTETGDEKR